MLFFQLGPAVFQHMLRLHGEAADIEPGVPVGGDPGQDILRPCQGNGQFPVPLFQLVVRSHRRAVVGYGGGLYQNIRPGQGGLDRLQHVPGSGDGHQRHPLGGGYGYRAGNQGHLRPPEHGLPGDGVAHFAGGVVGEIPHRVQGLLGGARRHGDVEPGHVLGPGNYPENFLHQILRLRELAAAHILTGQHPHGGLEDAEAIAAQGLQIFLGGGVFQHGGIHGRGHQLGAPGSQHRGGEHVVGQTVGQLGNHVGSGRGNENHVCRLGQGHMGHVILKIPVEGVHNAAVVGQGFKGQGRDEVGGILGENAVNLRPGFAQGTGHIGHLIGGDSSGNPQKHGFPFQIFHGFTPFLCGVFRKYTKIASSLQPMCEKYLPKWRRRGIIAAKLL